MEDSAFKLATAALGFFAVVLGVLLGKLLELGLAIYRRHERQLDVCVALYAEIGRGYSAIHLQNLPGIEEKFLDRPTSLVVANAANFAFDSIKSDISILPNKVIDAVFAYYLYDQQSNTMLKYMDSDAYRKAPASQKRRFRGEVVAVFKAMEASSPMALSAIHDEVERQKSKWYVRLFRLDIATLEHPSMFPRIKPADMALARSNSEPLNVLDGGPNGTDHDRHAP